MRSPTSSSAPLIETAEGKMPPGGAASFVTLRDGARLRTATWPLDDASASVFILPGRTEFIEKYGEVIGELLARRSAVGILDWRGQGLSDRPLADPLKDHIDSFDTYVEDFLELADGAFAHLPRPWIFLCHSMGATIGVQILLRRRLDIAGAVFSAPMWGVLIPGWPIPLARFIASGACIGGLADRFVFGGSGRSVIQESFEENIVTHDARRFARAKALVMKEPKLALGSATFGWLKATFESIRDLARPGVPESLALPSLVFMADQEQIVDNRRISALTIRMPRAKLIELHARHEILMEEDVVRAAFWREYDAFVAAMADVERGKASSPQGR